MKKSIFSIFLIAVIFFNIPAVYSSAASGVIVAVAEADGGKSLSELDSEEVVRVTVLLPKIDSTSKLQFDLVFDDAVFEYNGDADASAVLSLLTIGKAEAVGTNIIRLVAAGFGSASFAPETVALTASFTVKQNVSSGEKDAFSLAGLKCSDDSVSVMEDTIKITVSGEETTVPEVTTDEETTMPPEVTTAEETTAPPQVTDTDSVTEPETTKYVDTVFSDVTIDESDNGETSESAVTTTEVNTTQADEIDTVITTAKENESTHTDEVTENDDKENGGGVPIAVPVVISLVIACAVAVIVAFLYSKRVSLPK